MTTVEPDGAGRQPQRKRVTPTGDLIATPARGIFMGNRAYGLRWLVCELHFERTLTKPREYPKVFFLDEAVALSAGHRPCKTCRPDYYREFLGLARGAGDTTIGRADDLDKELNLARKAPRAPSSISSLPDGVFIALTDDDFRVVWEGSVHRWTPAGYVDPITVSALDVAEAPAITPAPSVAALRNGYRLVMHPSIAPAT